MLLKKVLSKRVLLKKAQPDWRQALCLWLLLCSQALLAAAPVQVIKSENDQRQYRHLTLPNQLQVLLVSDPATEKSAVALDVQVGSADDPQGRPGLAHFLEHMLFLGTRKYPKAGEYQQYIDSHGGNHNAYTSLEHTNYFFDIDPRYLEPALDRFAQFFLQPLLEARYVERERNAVHSEFTARYQDEGRRAWDVYREIFNPDNKSATFGVGNQDTLSDTAQSAVRQDLLLFYKKNYSANLMALVVLGKEPLDELERMARERFAAVENKNRSLDRKPVPLFAPQTLPAQLSIKPQQNQRELSLVFPMPVQESWYREKPVEYLAFLLGHEGEGSLYALLRDRGWIESLSAGSSLDNRWGSAFSVSMNLTEAGYQHRDQVIDECFRMIGLLNKEGVEKWRYNEQAVTQASLFRYQEKGEAISYVASLANNLHYYAPADVIQGQFLMQNFNAELIRDFLSWLRPDNVLVEINAPDVITSKKSRYYQTAYHLAGVEPADRQRWQQAFNSAAASNSAAAPDSADTATADGLRLPPPNEFVAKNFKLKSGAGKSRPVPELIKTEDNLQVWFHQDERFAVPRSGIYVYARSPYSAEGVRGAVLTAYFVRLLNRDMKDFSYPASLAGLELSLQPRSRGIGLQINGYSDKQGLLLTRSLDALAAPVFSQQDFDKVKEEFVRELKNRERQSPYLQLRSQADAVLLRAAHENRLYTEAAAAVSLKEVQEFSQRWLKSLSADVLVHGNVTESDALKLAAVIRSKLLLDGPRHPSPDSEVMRLPASSKPYLYDFTVDHADSALWYYIQGADDSIEEQARMRLLAQLMGADFFHELRTQQQLGYVVQGMYYPLVKVPGMVFLVQSPTHDVSGIDDSMQQFFGSFAKSLASMPAETFEEHRATLLLQLRETPKSLAEQGGEWWSDISDRYLAFDRRQQLIAAVQGLSQKAMADYYWKTFLAPERRRLSVAAVPRQQALDTAWAKGFERVEAPDVFKNGKSYYRVP